jgi:hypothetical protein
MVSESGMCVIVRVLAWYCQLRCQLRRQALLDFSAVFHMSAAALHTRGLCDDAAMTEFAKNIIVGVWRW